MEKSQFKKVFEEVKVDYPKMTYRLSVFGFIASIAFYLGVLRDLMVPNENDSQKIEQLTSENQRLNLQIETLNKKLDACEK